MGRSGERKRARGKEGWTRGSRWWGESGERIRRGWGHAAALRTRRTSEWIGKDGCLSLSRSLSLLLLLPPIAPSLLLPVIFLTSTLLVERQRNRARWRGESRLTTRRNVTTAFSLQRSNRQVVWTFLSTVSSTLNVVLFLISGHGDNKQMKRESIDHSWLISSGFDFEDPQSWMSEELERDC